MQKFSIAFLTFLCGAVHAVGTWKPAPTGLHVYGQQMNMLSDGTVISHTSGGGSYGNIWDILKPDSKGSYATGTWTSNLAPMFDTRIDFSSQILMDGRLYVAGGEYGTGGSAAEVYDPLTNKWTKTPPPGGFVSDACSAILPDGKVLQHVVGGGKKTLIYDPKTNTYSPGPSTLGGPNEAAWVKLPDNSILQVDINSKNSERYIPSLNKWVVDATVPVALFDPFGSETGGAVLLPNGKAFFLGSLGPTAVYTPSGSEAPGVWTATANIPNAQGTPDAPAAMMVNGKVLCAVSPIPTSANHFPQPVSYYEYDYLTNAFTQVGAPSGGLTRNKPTYAGNMLTLPDGTVLYSEQGTSSYWVYVPDGTQVNAGKPVIKNITHTGTDCSSGYTVTGTGFNGISEGATYGDDEQMNSNYPIIRLTKGADVYYGRTFNWNSTGVQRGSAPDTTQLSLPVGVPTSSTLSMVVTANGIASDPFPFTPSCGTAIKDFHLVLLGDFKTSITGSTLNVHFQISPEILAQGNNAWQLIKVDGKVIQEEKISRSGTWEQKIDLNNAGKGVFLFILKNAKNQDIRRIAVQ